jgi:probable rRNA maturation factor
MSRIHKQFMNIDEPTDVMTFPLEFDEMGNPTSGEVIVCVPEARRQARESGIPVNNEVLLYALHGLLHLCGFDDKTPAAFEAMHRQEDELLVRLGMEPVFKAGSLRQKKKPTAPSRRRARVAQSSGV